MPLGPRTYMSSETLSMTEEWTKKLVGKKIGETSDATTFARSELPEKSRVLVLGQTTTREFMHGRVNVYLNEDGIVAQVHVG